MSSSFCAFMAKRSDVLCQGNLEVVRMNQNKMFPISMTVLWSIVFASAMHSWVLGICMGLMMGMAFGLLDTGQKEDLGEDQESKGERKEI